MTDTLIEPTRTCRLCGEQKRLSQFRPRRRGGSERQHECTPCHNASERLRRAAKRRKDVARYVRALNQRRDLEYMRTLTIAMLNRFGGMHNFVSAWKSQIDEAVATKPGSELVFRQFSAVLRMIELSDQIGHG